VGFVHQGHEPRLKPLIEVRRTFGRPVLPAAGRARPGGLADGGSRASHRARIAPPPLCPPAPLPPAPRSLPDHAPPAPAELGEEAVAVGEQGAGPLLWQTGQVCETCPVCIYQ